ncbi:Hypothetical protein PBC10988_14400 [Planctomycetales bacterium 10988]|nr:Hypothetical protein PBC10988_14400 [Planctomycetales bacterium 10988]
MTQDVYQALQTFCDPPPDDLVKHFSEGSFPNDPVLHFNLLPLEDALDFSISIQTHAYLGEPLGLFALEDANNSNPYCYVSKGPAKGTIYYLPHDGWPEFAYDSLEDFLTAIRKAIESGTYIDDLVHDKVLPSIDRHEVANYTEKLLEEDALVEEIVAYIPLLDTKETKLFEKLVKHPEPCVLHAAASRVEESPQLALLDAATVLTNHPYPHVAQHGKKARAAIHKIKYQL